MRGLILGLFALSSVAVLVQSKPQFGGGGGFAGGLGAPENLRDPEIKEVLKFFKNTILQQRTNPGVNCQAKLKNKEVRKQQVAGVNFIINADIKFKGNGCGDIGNLKCTDFYVFKPLDGQCNSVFNPNNPDCLQLSSGIEEACVEESTDITPNPPTTEDIKRFFGNFMIEKEFKTSADNLDCRAVLDNSRLAEQVVAGTNHLISATVRFVGNGCGCPGCVSRTEPLTCNKITIFEPLSFNCNNPTPSNPWCLRVTSNVDSACNSGTGSPSPGASFGSAPGLPGGFTPVGSAAPGSSGSDLPPPLVG